MLQDLLPEDAGSLMDRVRVEAGSLVRHDGVMAAASLGQVLAARDRRAAMQRDLLALHGLPLLSLTLVSPGPVKDSPGRRSLMDMAESALSDGLHRAEVRVRQRTRQDGITGPEALWVVDTDPRNLKHMAIHLEDSRPWGRLLDADVIVPGPRREAVPVGRQALGHGLRRCLVCSEAAKTCIGLRSHHPSVLAAMVSALVGRFTGQP